MTESCEKPRAEVDPWQNVADAAYALDGECTGSNVRVHLGLVRDGLKELAANPKQNFEAYATHRLVEVVLAGLAAPAEVEDEEPAPKDSEYSEHLTAYAGIVCDLARLTGQTDSEVRADVDARRRVDAIDEELSTIGYADAGEIHEAEVAVNAELAELHQLIKRLDGELASAKREVECIDSTHPRGSEFAVEQSRLSAELRDACERRRIVGREFARVRGAGARVKLLTAERRQIRKLHRSAFEEN